MAKKEKLIKENGKRTKRKFHKFDKLKTITPTRKKKFVQCELFLLHKQYISTNLSNINRVDNCNTGKEE